MLKIYGTENCRFCVACKDAFDNQGIEYEFIEIMDELPKLKEFINIRDTNPVYEGIQGSGKLGVPLIETEDGTYTRDWQQFLPKKLVNVVAAVIREGDKVFATQRGYGEFKDGWEFPGGKIEPGEYPDQALVREIKEELDTDIKVGEKITTIEYDYPKFHLSMKCFWCKVVSGDLVLKEHEDSTWLSKEELDRMEWLPADKELINMIKKIM